MLVDRKNNRIFVLNLILKFQNFQIRNCSINDVIRDVFIDYTKNYMTPDDIIKGAGPVKWSFGSSVFFSWTAITTIGKKVAL